MPLVLGWGLVTLTVFSAWRLNSRFTWCGMTSFTDATRLMTGSLLSAFPVMRSVPLCLRQSVYHRIFYSKAHDFAYFRIPKCANSPVAMTLYAAIAAQDETSTLSDHGRTGSHQATLVLPR